MLAAIPKMLTNLIRPSVREKARQDWTRTTPRTEEELDEETARLLAEYLLQIHSILVTGLVALGERFRYFYETWAFMVDRKIRAKEERAKRQRDEAAEAGNGEMEADAEPAPRKSRLRIPILHPHTPSSSRFRREPAHRIAEKDANEGEESTEHQAELPRQLNAARPCQGQGCAHLELKPLAMATTTRCLQCQKEEAPLELEELLGDWIRVREPGSHRIPRSTRLDSPKFWNHELR